MTDIRKAKVHILDNEEESRAYIVQAWAEAMVLYQQWKCIPQFYKRRLRKKRRNCRKNLCWKIQMQELSRRFLMTMKTIMYVQSFFFMMRASHM